MGFKTLLEKVESSSVYQEFIKGHSDAELCAGFFILDFLSNDTEQNVSYSVFPNSSGEFRNNKETLDYKIGEKVFTFSLKDGEIKVGEDKLIEDSGRPQLVKIDNSVGVDVDELKSLVGVRVLDEGISAKINKIIAVLQKYDGYGGGNGGEGGSGGGKQIWNLTCMLDGLIILNVHVDAESGEILKFDRKSMMDMIQRKD